MRWRNSAGGRSASGTLTPTGGSPSTGSRWKSATASGRMRSHRWRSMASTRTAMCRQMLSGTACVRVNFSAADERLAAILYRRGVTLVHLQRAIWLGCARKYAALLNGSEHAPMLVSSLKYFSALIEEVAETSVGEDYWKHMQHKVNQLERIWLGQTPAGR